jgi:hypothetical protein
MARCQTSMHGKDRGEKRLKHRHRITKEKAALSLEWLSSRLCPTLPPRVGKLSFENFFGLNDRLINACNS